jgi:hypothetical protein
MQPSSMMATLDQKAPAETMPTNTKTDQVPGDVGYMTPHALHWRYTLLKPEYMTEIALL